MCVCVCVCVWEQVYQVYARRSPEEVHAILRAVGADYVVLENSICYERRHRRGCRLRDLLDLANGHVGGLYLKWRIVTLSLCVCVSVCVCVWQRVPSSLPASLTGRKLSASTKINSLTSHPHVAVAHVCCCSPFHSPYHHYHHLHHSSLPSLPPTPPPYVSPHFDVGYSTLAIWITRGEQSFSLAVWLSLV